MTNINSEIWAITTYYNPIKYKNRNQNFKVFKKNLNIPLITVELGNYSNFELNVSDSEILIQVVSNSIMWHKEKLLNVALKHLPEYVKYVAWLDCDIIFENKEWEKMAIKKLNSHKMIQLFSELHDLPANTYNFESYIPSNGPSGYSIAFLNEEDRLSKEDFNPTETPSMRRGLFGLAWAARKDVLFQLGFYDAMVVGSGDRAMACAGFGRFEDAVSVASLTNYRREHYLEWATQFNSLIKESISFLNGRLFHLWHGDLSNRRYLERHREFNKLNFNPYVDIVTNEFGCWEWREKDSKFQNFMKSYLTSRKEDGENKTLISER
jgi:hypothetical protein